MSWAWLAEVVGTEAEIPKWDCGYCQDTGLFKVAPMPDPGFMDCPYCSTRRSRV